MKRMKKGWLLAIVIILLSMAGICSIFFLNDEYGSNTHVDEKEKITIESAETATAPVNILDNLQNTEDGGRIYDYWWEFKDEKYLSCVDDETFEFIKEAYAKVDFAGEFKRENPEVTDAYREIYKKMLQGEIPVRDKATGEEFYITDLAGVNREYDVNAYKYYFFDADEDDFPELGVESDNGATYIFKYNRDSQECILWYAIGNYCWSFTGSSPLLGSRKVAYPVSGEYLVFYQLDQSGSMECETFFMKKRINQAESFFIVMLPKYAEKEREMEVLEEMKAQGAFVRNGEEWYFRVTEEQYEELCQPYWDEYKAAQKKIEEVTYTYEELFGAATLQKWLAYDYWGEFREEKDLPYADDKTFEFMKEMYAEVDFEGEFKRGNPDVTDEYREIYQRMVQGEIPIRDKTTDEAFSITDLEGFDREYDVNAYEYYFFDVDEDDFPELGVRIRGGATYLFKYDQDSRECRLWYLMESYWETLLGGRKIAWPWEGKYSGFYQLDQSGNVECETFFLANWFNEEESLYMIMLPKYAEKEREMEVSAEMKAQGVYERGRKAWYFRVTEEQFEELCQPYWDAYKASQEKIREVTYTYEELFDYILSH